VGAQEDIRYTEQDFVSEVKCITGGKFVRAVFDSVDKDTFIKSLDCVAVRGMMVSFGQSSGEVEGFEPMVLSAKGSLYLARPTLGYYVADAETLQKRASEVLGWVAGGRLSVRVGTRFPLAEASEAHRQLESASRT
jgi:NADPH:quinone reductase